MTEEHCAKKIKEVPGVQFNAMASTYGGELTATRSGEELQASIRWGVNQRAGTGMEVDIGAGTG